MSKEDKKIHNNIRNRIRFFQQIGILLEDDLLNEEMVFSIIGAGFKLDYKKLDIAVEAIRVEHNNNDEDKDKTIYDKIEYVKDRYEKWNKNKKAKMVTRIS